jgi:hypothetical protein
MFELQDVCVVYPVHKAGIKLPEVLRIQSNLYAPTVFVCVYIYIHTHIHTHAYPHTIPVFLEYKAFILLLGTLGRLHKHTFLSHRIPIL